MSSVGRISEKQKKVLIDFAVKNPTLVKGKFCSTFTKKDGQQLWNTLAVHLNGIPGSKKSWKQWRKTWQDIFSKVKSKYAAMRRQRAQPQGSLSSRIIFTALEKKIIGIFTKKLVKDEPNVEKDLVDPITAVVSDNGHHVVEQIPVPDKDIPLTIKEEQVEEQVNTSSTPTKDEDITSIERLLARRNWENQLTLSIFERRHRRNLQIQQKRWYDRWFYLT